MKKCRGIVISGQLAQVFVTDAARRMSVNLHPLRVRIHRCSKTVSGIRPKRPLLIIGKRRQSFFLHEASRN